MKNPFRFFASGEDRPLLSDQGQIDRLYKRNRVSIMVAITVGQGLPTCAAWACRSSRSR